jgi:hypothetical protein
MMDPDGPPVALPVPTLTCPEAPLVVSPVSTSTGPAHSQQCKRQESRVTTLAARQLTRDRHGNQLFVHPLYTIRLSRTHWMQLTQYQQGC